MCKTQTVAVLEKHTTLQALSNSYVHVVTIMVQTSVVFSMAEPAVVDPMEQVHSIITLLLPCTLASMVSVCHQILSENTAPLHSTVVFTYGTRSV